MLTRFIEVGFDHVVVVLSVDAEATVDGPRAAKMFGPPSVYMNVRRNVLFLVLTPSF